MERLSVKNLLPRTCETHKLIMTCSLSHFIVVSMVVWLFLLLFESSSSVRLLFRLPASFCSSDAPFSVFQALHCQTMFFVALLCIFSTLRLGWIADFPEFLLLVGRSTFVTLYCTFLWGTLINSDLNCGILCELTLYLQYKTNTFYFVLIIMISVV